MRRNPAEGPALKCEIRRVGDKDTQYYSPDKAGIIWTALEKDGNEYGTRYTVTVRNSGDETFNGVLHFKLVMEAERSEEPKFFMPGYMYNRNTADMPSSGRKAFPRIKRNPEHMPESEYFMTRADRLALPVSLIYSRGHVTGLSGAPCIKSVDSDSLKKHCGFTCSINDEGAVSVGYTLGYENAPWLFVQTATVKDRAPLTAQNAFSIGAGGEYSFELTVYDYEGQDERAIYCAITDVYKDVHEAPRSIDGMDKVKALTLLSSAIRDYAWLPGERRYTGFVYDRPEGLAYNRIPSLTWTNGLAVAVPMLMAADRLKDDLARTQAITFIDDVVEGYYNSASGFLYESTDENGKPTVRGWWYNGMHSGGHSGYLNGQAVYYLLKAYVTELKEKNVMHSDWLGMAEKVVARMNEVLNTDYEYPFAMSEESGAGIEYDSMGSAWCLAATAMYELASGDRGYMELLRMSEEHYYSAYVKKVECYGGPLDTDKAVDSEGILSIIRADRILHEITGDRRYLDHLRDALYYEFTFKLGYNTPVSVRPLSDIGWSSCGGSITSTANPHIHPMSSTVTDEMRYYLKHCADEYVGSRLKDTEAWGMQTFNTYDGEYGYGRIGWMSERFCFCEGLLTEKYPDGEPASTWFALMPWAAASIIEGLI